MMIAAIRVRWYRTEFKGDRGTKSKPIPGPHLVKRFPNDGTERGGRANPPESYADDPDDAGGMRRVDACAMG